MLLWVPYGLLVQYDAAKRLRAVTTQREAKYSQAVSEAVQDQWDSRKAVMSPFLDLKHLQESILVHHGLGGLVGEAMAGSAACRAAVYVYWSLLCRFGLDEKSLMPRLDRCGEPGTRKFSEPGGRRKAGRLTAVERLHLQRQRNPLHPGMSQDWHTRILAGDALIPTPKPKMEVRCTAIYLSHFVCDYRFEGSKLQPVLPPQIPNKRQIARVLNTLPALRRIIDSTTIGHYQRNLRPLHGRSWQNVAGPGHTWAIDSTIGDIYLRSSVNRHWIIGRPIVYVIVDVWSTAVIGFYVCLSGPSWATAQISLFNACADPNLLGELWGYVPMYHLSPLPTRCFEIWCDRGEYLSQAASHTFFKLIPKAGYMPPYRPDLKGIVEVLHRIAKDAMNQQFVPGAIDARRAEYELRQFNASKGTMTVREFVQWLHILFCVYNFTADRRARLDAHMRSAGITGSPAGLWRFGHEAGIGYQASSHLDDLITLLLPSGQATVTNGGVSFNQALYKTNVEGLESWSALARVHGNSVISAHHYPGSISRIWTPYGAKDGLTCLHLSDQSASSELTLDEHLDSLAYGNLNRAEDERHRTEIQVAGLHLAKKVADESAAKTAEADAEAASPRPPIREARAVESGLAPAPAAAQGLGAAPAPTPPPSSADAEARAAYLADMSSQRTDNA